MLFFSTERAPQSWQEGVRWSYATVAVAYDLFHATLVGEDSIPVEAAFVVAAALLLARYSGCLQKRAGIPGGIPAPAQPTSVVTDQYPLPTIMLLLVRLT